MQRGEDEYSGPGAEFLHISETDVKLPTAKSDIREVSNLHRKEVD